MLTHTLGFPRIGADRDLKKALEAFWQGQIEEADLQGVARDLRLRHWRLQADRGVDLVPVGDFSLYDQVLDTTAMLGAVPDRYGWARRAPGSGNRDQEVQKSTRRRCAGSSGRPWPVSTSWGWTCSCTASPNGTTWSSTLRSSSQASA
jgi:hypothetical protein